MTPSPFILAIDQGTTSTRAILFDREGQPIAQAQQPLRQIYPQPGWVEHDPLDIWRDTLAVCREALLRAEVDAPAAIGITNQRETTILWDRASGLPVHNAIVWQDRRTADFCDRLVAEGHAPMLTARTGLVVDAYFSASKIAWLLDSVPGLRARAERGELAFGTVDSWLLWRLTNGARHATDATNASRTLLFDIHRQDWDDDLLALFRIPRALLPEVLDCDADFGTAAAEHLGKAVPVLGVAGDQHAAVIGQACVRPGMIKSTYGTGCFALLNTGDKAVASRHRLLTTLAYRVGGRVAYALEGSIFNAGTAVQWLRDELRLFGMASETENLARRADPAERVYMVPAFTGLGAPHWDPDARGAILGLTRASGIAEIARAALESVCFQTHDLMEAMAADVGSRPVALRVDGGMVANDWMVQALSDILDLPVDRPAVTETTALGAAYLAGMRAGLYPGLDALDQAWRCERAFTPAMPAERRDGLLAGWRDAIARVRSR